MLYTKFHGIGHSGSVEGFFRFLPYLGMAVIFVMRPRPFEETFVCQENAYEIQLR